MDFNKLSDVLAARKKSQEADEDLRDRARDSVLFVNKHDGQWEPDIIRSMSKRPRYTLDKCNPIVDQLCGEINNADFAIRVRPAGGEATKDNAKIFDGMIRNIQNVSNFEQIKNAATKGFITAGVDGWEIVQDWEDADSFEQGLFIRKIHNFLDRVWFDPNAENQDNSDAKWVIVDSTMSCDEFEMKFPDAAESSLTESRSNNAYSNKKSDFVIIGRLYYKKPETIELALMSDGSVYRIDEKYESIVDDLAQPVIDPVSGAVIREAVTEVDRRKRKTHKVYSRLFSNDTWLTDEEETVFRELPVVAAYGNYSVFENKRIWRGIVENLKDPQRIYNYSVSRQIEEGALAPRAKYWMTMEQGAGHERQLRTLNTNADPVQFYTHQDNQPPPFQQGGAQINQGLQVTSQQASADINAAAGIFTANIGDNPGLQSGVALDIQTDKGNNSMVKWIESLEVAICQTAKILIDAIPRVYDSTRAVRIMGEDGSFDQQTINKPVFDAETGEVVEMNNLAAGTYDVVCEAGLAFKTRQKEEKAQFVELAQIMPELVQFAGDVLLKNVEGDGMRQAAERLRLQMINAGTIPEDQLTDEEKQRLAIAQQQAAQQPQQPDPVMIAAQAEMVKAQADMLSEQNKQTELQIRAQDVALKAEAQQKDLEAKLNIAAAHVERDQIKMSQDQQKIDNQQQQALINAAADQDKIELNAQKLSVETAMKAQEQRFNEFMQTQQLQMEKLMTAIQGLAGIKTAMGVDAVIGDTNTQAYIDQADMVLKAQDDIDPTNNI